MEGLCISDIELYEVIVIVSWIFIEAYMWF
jgi:hypothetical protein